MIELEQEIDKIVNASIFDFAKDFIAGNSQNKKIYRLIEDVVVKFSDWKEKHGWLETNYQDKTWGNKELFQYFINNIYTTTPQQADGV